MPFELHLAPTGNNRNSGDQARPLATPAAARDRLRAARSTGTLPPDGAVVILHAGTYRLDTTVMLVAEDSGTSEGPIIYRAATDEQVVLTGGVALDPAALCPVTDPAILERLPENSRNPIRVVSLRACGVAIPSQPCAAELSFRGMPMTLARWPNAGYARLGGPPEVTHPDGMPRAAKLEDGFLYYGDRPRVWRSHDDLWVHIWGNDWATARVKIDRINLDRRHITTCAPYGTYSFPKNGRFFYFNILEELDEPCEYYLDRRTDLLYVWPVVCEVEGLPATAWTGDLVLSMLEAPLIELNGVEHVRIENLTLQNGRASGLVIRGGADVHVNGCTIANFGNHGIEITGGRRHAVRACEVRYVGASGITLSGGDRRTLERADHMAENNYIHHYALWHYCYEPGVGVGGGSYQSLMGSVGIRIAHNRIHDSPHNGILYWGNDLEIENNDIYRVVMEGTDAGAIYTGRDFARRGSIIRHNYIHHNGVGGPFGTMGIYLDDCAGGERIVGNVLQGLKQAVYMGGGTDTICENNLFVDCAPSVHLDMRGILPGLKDICRQRFYEVAAHQPPYSTHYPDLAKIHAHYEKGEGIPPEGTRVCRNIAVGSGEFWSYASVGVDRRCLVEEKNLVGAPVAHVDLKRGGLVASHAAREKGIGFERIPMERIGLVRDASRPEIPPRSLLDYRLVVETPWAWRDNATTNPVLRLEAVNLGEARETGVAEVFVSPAEEAPISGETRMAFDLAPGASVRSAPLVLTPDASLTSLELGIRRLGTADVPRWHWLYLQHELTVPVLGALGDVGKAATALAAVTPLRTASWDGRHGQIRLGLTDEALALTLDLQESELIPRTDNDWWKDSCVELFASGPASPVAEQIGLIPAGNGVSAQALWFHDGVRQAGAPGVQVACEIRPNGYCLMALIPDWLLGWDRKRSAPALEISISAKPEAAAPRTRVRIFGIEIWMNERKRFCRLI